MRARATAVDVISAGARAALRRPFALPIFRTAGAASATKVEAHLVNPLSRALFDRRAVAEKPFRIEQGLTTQAVTTLHLVAVPVATP